MDESVLPEIGAHLAIFEHSLRVRPERFHLVSPTLEMLDGLLESFEERVLHLGGVGEHITGAYVRKQKEQS